MLPFLASWALPWWQRHTAPADGETLLPSQIRDLSTLVRILGPLPVGERRNLRRLMGRGGRDLWDAFRAEVPASEYADYDDLVRRVAIGEEDVLFPGRAVALAQTSGTTRGADAGERYVPQSAALLRHHQAGGSAALARVLGETGTQALGGRMLFIGGSSTLDPAHGVPVGDLSGIIVQRLPAWARRRYEPGLDIAAMPGWPERLEAMSRRLGTTDIRLVSGIASWLLLLFAEVCAKAGRSRVRDVWPRLGTVIHGGHPMDAFVAPMLAHLPPETRLFEVYPASEAFIGIGSRSWRLDEGQPPAMQALAGKGVVLEFQPDGEDATCAVGAEALEAGQVYRVLVTTPGGLVRYAIGDLVRGAGPGRFHFAGRIRTRISAGGEHVEGAALDAAAAAAQRDTGAAVAFYHVAPVLPDARAGRGRHEWWVEFQSPPTDPSAFAAAIDGHLRRTVIDYDAHRTAGQLTAPSLVSVPTGTFRRWLEAKRRDGGQHKVPVAWPDRTIADQLASIVSDLHHGT